MVKCVFPVQIFLNWKDHEIRIVRVINMALKFHERVVEISPEFSPVWR